MSNKITQIYESFDEDDTNRYLADGWEIVAVVSGTRLYGPNQQMETGPVYVLGKRELPEQLGILKPRDNRPRS